MFIAENYSTGPYASGAVYYGTFTPAGPNGHPTTAHNLGIHSPYLPFTQSQAVQASFGHQLPGLPPHTKVVVKFFDFRYAHLSRDLKHAGPWTSQLQAIMRDNFVGKRLDYHAAVLAEREKRLEAYTMDLFEQEKAAYESIAQVRAFKGWVPKYYGTFLTMVDGMAVNAVLMEYIDGVPLSKILDAVDSREAGRAARMAMRVVKSSTAIGFDNKDWKARNFVIKINKTGGRASAQRAVMLDFAHAKFHMVGQEKHAADGAIVTFQNELTTLLGHGWKHSGLR